MAFFTGSKQADDQEEKAKNTVFFFELLQKNVLITGANGQLGNELRRLTDINPNNNFRFYFTDIDTVDITNISDLEQYVKDNSIKYIINCAAFTAVDKAEDDYEKCYQINRDAVVNIAEVAHRNKIRVIHISTDYIFDGKKDVPYTETDTVYPQSVYGKSKHEGEVALMEICPESIIIRTAWLYSIYGKNFVKTIINNVQECREMNIVSDQKGTPTNAADLAWTIGKILDYSEDHEFKAGIYNFSDEGETTWYNFAIKIVEYAGIKTYNINPIPTSKYPTKAIRPNYSVLDKSKIKQTFGISIPQWEESLVDCIKEIQNNQS